MVVHGQLLPPVELGIVQRLAGGDGEGDDGEVWLVWERVNEECRGGTMNAKLVGTGEERHVEGQWRLRCKDAFPGSSDIELPVTEVLQLAT